MLFFLHYELVKVDTHRPFLFFIFTACLFTRVQNANDVRYFFILFYVVFVIAVGMFCFVHNLSCHTGSGGEHCKTSIVDFTYLSLTWYHIFVMLTGSFPRCRLVLLHGGSA